MNSGILSAKDSVDDTILSSLVHLKEQFYVSLEGGCSALPAFEKSWAAFNSTVGDHTSSLQKETQIAIYSFAENVNTFASALLGLESATESIFCEFQGDVTKILTEQMSDLSIRDCQSFSTALPNDAALHIKLASGWLLANLHNPYPSNHLRDSICHRTNSCRQDIDAWFADARKRIGWNSIRKQLYPKKKDMLEAAMHYFHGVVPSRKGVSSMYSKVVIPEAAVLFAAMEQRAVNLYSHDLSGTDSDNIDVKDFGTSSAEPTHSKDRKHVTPQKNKFLSSVSPTSLRKPEKRKFSAVTSESEGEDHCILPRKQRRKTVTASTASSACSKRQCLPCSGAETDVSSMTKKRKRRPSDACIDAGSKRHATMPADDRLQDSFKSPVLPDLTQSHEFFYEWLRGVDAGFVEGLSPSVTVMRDLFSQSAALEIDTCQFNMSPLSSESSLAPETPPGDGFIDDLPSQQDSAVVAETVDSNSIAEDPTLCGFQHRDYGKLPDLDLSIWNYDNSLTTFDTFDISAPNSLWFSQSESTSRDGGFTSNNFFPQIPLVDWLSPASHCDQIPGLVPRPFCSISV